MWLEVGATNKDPAVVAGFFTNCIPTIGGTAFGLRFDDGTENGHMADIQTLITGGNGHSTFGRSTANQRIEAYWGLLKKTCLQEWMNLFKDMIDNGEFNNADPLHVEALRYFFGRILRTDLDNVKNEWNTHRIRLQHNSEVPSGSPDVLYHLPQHTDTVDFKLPVDIDMLEDLDDIVVQRIPLFGPDISDLVELLFGEQPSPSTIQDARDSYNEFMHRVEEYL